MTTLFEIGLINAALATVLAVGVWIVTRIWRQPVLAHALWVVVLVKLVTPPLIDIPWQITSTPRMEAAQAAPVASIGFDQVAIAPMIEQHLEHAPVAADATLPAIATNDVALARVDRVESPQQNASFPIDTFITLAAVVWLAGSGIFLAVTIIRLTAFHRALANASPATPDLEALAEQVATRLGVRSYRLCVTEGRLTPLVWPIGQPTIVFSRPLLAELSADEIQTLLAHEFAHLRRKDHWVRWLELAAVTIYWWLPVAWCARTMIRRTEERACDAWVTWAFPDTAVRYATALFTTVEFVTNPRPAPPMVASRLSADGNLTERIKDVMNGNCDRRLSFVSKCAILIVALVALPLSLRGVQAADEPAAPGGAAITTTTSEAGNTTAPVTGARSTVTLSDAGIAPVPGEPGTGRFQQADTNSAGTTGMTLSYSSSKPASKIEQEIEEKLQSPVKVDFTDVPLSEALSVLSDSVNIDIHLDRVRLEEAGLSSDVPVTITLKNKVSLRSALNLILKPFDLKYVVEDEVLKITTGPLPTPTLTYSVSNTSSSNSNKNDAQNATATTSVSSSSSATSDSDAPASLSVWKKIAEGKQRSYERMQALAQKHVVSSSEVEQAKNEYEISRERWLQAGRALETNKLQIQLAEIELQEAVEANKAKAGSVNDLQLQKLKIKLQLANAKLRELSE